MDTLNRARQEALQAAAQDHEYELTLRGRRSPVHDSQGRVADHATVEEFVARPDGGFQTEGSIHTHTAQTQSAAPYQSYVPPPLAQSTQPWTAGDAGHFNS